MSKHESGEWMTTRNNAINFLSAFGTLASLRVIHANGWDVAYCPPTDGDGGNANAERIVRAVNCHDELVAALTKIAELDGDCEGQTFRLTRFQAAQIARAALLAAVGEAGIAKAMKGGGSC